jgi:hypothetical protein
MQKSRHLDGLDEIRTVFELSSATGIVDSGIVALEVLSIFR